MTTPTPSSTPVGLDVPYMGISSQNPGNNWYRRRDPTVRDFQNYQVLDRWINLLTGSIFMLQSKANGSSTWALITTSGGSVTDLNGDTGTAVPTDGAITIAGGTGITTSATGSTLTVALDSPVSVDNGGTGVATLTDHGVMLGQGTDPVVVTAAGATGLPLVGQGAAADPIFTSLGVAGGGTGVTTLTGLALGSGTSAFTGVSYTAVTAWTPQLQFGGANVGMTFAAQSGFFQRVGSMVFVTAVLTLTAKGSSTGNATISNMPVAAGANGSFNHIYVGQSDVTLTADYESIDLATTNNSTVANLTMIGSAETILPIDDTMFADTSTIWINGFYFVN